MVIIMTKKILYYDSKDGQNRIHAVRWTPDKEPVAVVQIIHGMAEYIERYEEFARFLTEKGFVVTGEDHLGHGKSVGKDGTYGYFCEEDPASVVVEDVHRLRKYTQKEYKDLPYFMIGHSMGSYILRNYLSRYGEGLSGAVIMGTGSMPTWMLMANWLMTEIGTWIFGSKKEAKLIDTIIFGSYNQRILQPETNVDWLSKNQESNQKYIKDKLCGFIFTMNGFRTLGTFVWRAQDKKRISKIPKQLPILMVAGKEDPVGNYGEGVTNAYNTLKSAGITDIKMKLYENDRHELVNETDREDIYEDIYGWIHKILK